MLAALQHPRLVVQQPNQAALLLRSSGQQREGRENLDLVASPSSNPAHSLGSAKASAPLGKKLGSEDRHSFLPSENNA